eukprot:scaffold219174_cov39-Tisochrysis_lutea.AAC.3
MVRGKFLGRPAPREKLNSLLRQAKVGVTIISAVRQHNQRSSTAGARTGHLSTCPRPRALWYA